MYPRLFRLSLTILFALSSSYTLAADLQDLSKDRQAVTRANNSANLNAAFGLTRQETLAIAKTLSGKRGSTYTHYQQVYKGIPVWGERLIIVRSSTNTSTTRMGLSSAT